MNKKIITTIAASLMVGSVFAADNAQKTATKDEMQTIQCIPGTLAERQAQNRTNFDKNMEEGLKEKILNADDVKKMKAANEVFVSKIMPYVEKKNPMMFCVNIEADLKSKNIPFATGQGEPTAKVAK